MRSQDAFSGPTNGQKSSRQFMATIPEENDPQSDWYEKDSEARDKRADELVEHFLKEEPSLPESEEAFVRWCCSFYAWDDLTLPQLKRALSSHRSAVERRLRKWDQEDQESKGSSKKQKPSNAQQLRRQLRQDAIDAYYDLLDDAFSPDDIAIDEVGELFFQAHSDLVDDAIDEAIFGIASSLADRELSVREQTLYSGQKKRSRKKAAEDMDALAEIQVEREITDSDIDRVKDRLRRRLSETRHMLVEQYHKQSKGRALWHFFDGEYNAIWEERSQGYREDAISWGIDIEPIIKLYRDEVMQFVKRYQGSWPIEEAKEDMFELLDDLQHAVQRRIDEEEQFQRLVSLYEAHSDFRSCFPAARNMSRQIEFYCGPTNSGKTHAAMDALASGESGVYLAPLRLLALEGQENLLSRGVKASFLTGEEQELMDDAPFVSSTIEMLDYQTPIDAAVIDEIQLIGDPQRGWAWTNALVGVPARRVILTGSPDALPLIKQIAQFLEEPLIVREFQRFNPLEPMAECVSLEGEGIEALHSGMAIVCFSRREVLEIKQHIEANTDKKVSVIYGGLAPEVRRKEARRFREREADILVATDAISMGLNLPIHTVLFWSVSKRYDGQVHPLNDSEIKQIGGRAGRYGMEDRGYVGAFHPEDLERVAGALASELGPLEGPCHVMPLLFHVELISRALHTNDLVYILRYFCERIYFSKELFSPVVTEDMLQLARMLEEFTADLPLFEKYTFACAPVNMRATDVVHAHLHFAELFAEGEEVPMPSGVANAFKKGSARTASELRDAEDAVLVATLYQWLSYRFPNAFVDVEEAAYARETINRYISRSLERGRLGRACSQCGARLPVGFRFGVCENCFSKRRKKRRPHRRR